MEFLAIEMQIPSQRRIYASLFVEQASAKEMLELKIYQINDAQSVYLSSKVDLDKEVYYSDYFTMYLYDGAIYVKNVTLISDTLSLLIQAFVFKKMGDRASLDSTISFSRNFNSVMASVDDDINDIGYSQKNMIGKVKKLAPLKFFDEADFLKACKKFKVKAKKVDKYYSLSFGKCAVSSPIEGTINYKDIILYVDCNLFIKRVIFKFNNFWYDTEWQWNLKFFHPHINDNHICMGNKSDDIMMYGAGLLYELWLDLTKESLNTYSPDGAPYDSIYGISNNIATITAKINGIDFTKEMKSKTLEEKSHELFTKVLSSNNLRRCRRCSHHILGEHCTQNTCPGNPNAQLHCAACSAVLERVMQFGDSYGFNCPTEDCRFHSKIDFESFRIKCVECGSELRPSRGLLTAATFICDNNACDIYGVTQAHYVASNGTISLVRFPHCISCDNELVSGRSGFYCSKGCFASDVQYSLNGDRILETCPNCADHPLLEIIKDRDGVAIQFYCNACEEVIYNITSDGRLEEI